MAYFLVALCLCADSPTGFDGGGTSQSRDPCRHSLVSDSDSLSCPRGKLLCERRLDVNTAQLEMAKVAVSQRSNEYPVSLIFFACESKHSVEKNPTFDPTAV